MGENIAMSFIRSFMLCYCTRVSVPILLVDCIVIGVCSDLLVEVLAVQQGQGSWLKAS